jgi:DNA-directed RNA polymerase subunit M/transcription elongation factor TFIIS
MAKEAENQFHKQQSQNPTPRCPKCGAFPRFSQAMLQPRSGETLKLYKCQCGEHVWGESALSHQEV